MFIEVSGKKLVGWLAGFWCDFEMILRYIWDDVGMI